MPRERVRRRREQQSLFSLAPTFPIQRLVLVGAAAFITKSCVTPSFGIAFAFPLVHLGLRQSNAFRTHVRTASPRDRWSWSNLRRRSCLDMGKGDGKKKRKKKPAASPAASPAPSDALPMRVTSDSNISVKKQIKWARMKKEYSQVGQSFRQKKVVRTKYRRTWDEEEIEEKRVERSKRGKEPDWDVILNRTATAPLFIVDGYNVIHKWPRLKKWMNKGQLSRARETLVQDLENLRLLKGWRIECVFDGAGKATAPGPLGDGPGSSDNNAKKIQGSATEDTKSVTSHGVRVVYTGAGASADSYIEHRCFDAKKVTGGEMTGSLIVASDDGMIRLAGTNAGALCMSSGRLVDELKATRAAIMHRVEVAVAEANGHGVRPSALHGTAAPGRFQNKMMVVDKRKKNDTASDNDAGKDAKKS
mmetsp:Transcript_37686/g.82571  ORF Transcript_37686/g.82571 Transcript_37686/m.82571 type:complete len:418 (-) Transcript_37686:64-1317(-)